MTDEEIYKYWKSVTKDLRYFRPRRWKQLKNLIQSHQLKSVLEFGSGISTYLFSNLGMKVVSYETDLGYMSNIREFCSKYINNIEFIFWDNKNAWPKGKFDLTFIDGILPRTDQLRVGLKHAPFIAIDDFEGPLKFKLSPMLTDCKRIDDHSTTLALFKQRYYGRSSNNS